MVGDGGRGERVEDILDATFVITMVGDVRAEHACSN